MSSLGYTIALPAAPAGHGLELGHLAARGADGKSDGKSDGPHTPSPRVFPPTTASLGNGLEHEIFTSLAHFLTGRLQIARAAAGGRGGRAGSVARRPRVGTTAPGRQHHEKRRAIKGSSKGFFHRQGGAFDSTFYVQGTNLVRRLALEYVSTSACRTRWTYPTRSTGPADRLPYVRAPAGR